jgi:hypothetical protein
MNMMIIHMNLVIFMYNAFSNSSRITKMNIQDRLKKLESVDKLILIDDIDIKHIENISIQL